MRMHMRSRALFMHMYAPLELFLLNSRCHGRAVKGHIRILDFIIPCFFVAFRLLRSSKSYAYIYVCPIGAVFIERMSRKSSHGLLHDYLLWASG